MRQPFGGTPSASQRFERTISRYTLEYGPRDPAVEAMRLPSLVRAYRETCPSPEIAPTQAAFADWVQHLVSRGHDPREPLPDVGALRARAGRAYISLVVQHHAYLVLLETFGAVAWDDDLDMRYGVDLVVIGCDAVAVGLALRAPTPRSREQAARKAARYERLPFAIRTLEVTPHDYTAGMFWLYRPEALVGVVMRAVRDHWAAKIRRLNVAAAEAYASGRRRPKASRQDFMDGVEAALTALRAAQP